MQSGHSEKCTEQPESVNIRCCEASIKLNGLHVVTFIPDMLTKRDTISKYFHGKMEWLSQYEY